MSTLNNRGLHQYDVLSELNSFILGVSQITDSDPLDLLKSSLFLLKNLPASRDAVLDYFCYLFDNAVRHYIQRTETEITTGETPETSSKEEAAVAEIHTVLCNFINQNPQAWTPIISTWSLELLGELSTKYAGRAHVSVSAGLNEILQLWMGCRPTRTLIDITTQCLTSLMHSDSETWMNTLLNTSVKHSPHFDWVVAHVGSCFPNAVITRVLSCGLKDFCQYKTIETGSNAPKLISVVGILSHLAGSHFSDIRSAILELFSWSLRPYDLLDIDIKTQKISTVPFLLQLACLSPTLLRAMSTDIQHTLRGNIIYQLYVYIYDWCKYFSSPKKLQDIIVQLILTTEQDGIQIISLLLSYIFSDGSYSKNPQIVFTIKETAHMILEYVLQELDYYVRTQQTANILTSIMSDLPSLFEMLLQPEQLVYETAVRLIILVSNINSHILITANSFLLQNSITDEHLSMTLRLFHYQRIYCKEISVGKNVLVEVIKQNLLQIFNEGSSLEKIKSEQFWLNILTILKWDRSKKVLFLKNNEIIYAIHSNLKDIVFLFGSKRFDLKISHLIAEILLIYFQKNNVLELPPSLIVNLVNSSVNYFFLCCTERDYCSKQKSIKIICEIFNKLSISSKSAKIMSLREFLERSIFKKESLLFGADVSEYHNKSKNQQSLLTMNHKRSTTMMLTQRHSSIFHAGIIGNGCRKPSPSNPFSKTEVVANVGNLIRVLKSCCSIQLNLFDTEALKKSSLSLDSLTTVSLLLVQLISPDVMYNGLPWPEEDFSKVTIERDLYIRRLFSKSPLLWELMNIVAIYRPVICYCSVILRAITATLLHQWSSTACQTNTLVSSNFKFLLFSTSKLIDLMSIGQLLLPPLSNIRDIVPFLKPHEIVQLLRDCVWIYMRDHIPSPALFNCDCSNLYWRDPSSARPQSLYTDTLRIIMQSNIHKLGEQYAQLFYNV